MQPEKRTGASELEDICKYLPNIHKYLHQIANICDQKKSAWLEEVRTSRGNLRRETFMLGELGAWLIKLMMMMIVMKMIKNR